MTPEIHTGTIADVHTGELKRAAIRVENGRITSIEPADDVAPGVIMPGFVDAHVHVESSMLTPAAFARTAVCHGTVATVSDPHEIANVLGLQGLEFMLDSAADAPMHIAFGVPSCVPATPFESAGAVLGPDEVEALLDDDRFTYLSEMMNWPGVISADPDVHAKLDAARRRGKPIDGHAPLVTGEALRKYAAAGITTDHECTSEAEAREKLALGMRIAIREGSAARNFDALADLIGVYPGQVMLCSDDKHPDELLAGHIDRLAARAVAGGLPWQLVLRVACVTPVAHYRLPTGLLRVGDRADFIRVSGLEDFEVRETWIAGRCVARAGQALFDVGSSDAPNRFLPPVVTAGDFAIRAEGSLVRAIRAIDGSLVTGEEFVPVPLDGRLAVADPSNDLLKIVVVNRYAPSPPAVGFIRGFGLRAGAIASSVAHDSHNIVAVGVDDDSLARAVRALGRSRGGLAVVAGPDEQVMPLPVAGLMTTGSCEEAALAYGALDTAAKALGCPLRAPFMTLSFMALLVIPSLKLGDRGLFDGRNFEFVPVFAD